MNLGSDIRIKGSFFSHYKTLKLAKRLGWEGPIRLQQLWFFAAEHRPDGDLCNMDDDDIALASGWMQETETFVSALVDCSWLDGEPGARSLHDYQEHQPWVQERIQRQTNSAKGGRKAAASLTPEERAERARHAASARWSDAESVPSECLDDAKCTKHSVSIDAKCAKHGMLAPDQTRSRPDPDQEEYRTPSISPVAGDGVEQVVTPEPEKKVKPEPVTLNRETLELDNLTPARIAAWTRDYPGVDIDEELAGINRWCKTATAKALKIKRWSQFIDNWLQKALADKATRPQHQPQPPKPPKPKPLRIAPSSEFDWPATKKFLESTLEPDLYTRWIEPLTYEGMSERGAVLVAADQYTANYVWYNLRDPLGDAILVAHGLAVPFCCLSRSSLAGAGS